MIEFASASLLEFQPHQAGVRFGKCPDKTSQKSKGLAHHLARGQPRRYVTLPSPAPRRQIASEPASGASLATSVFVMKRPWRPEVLRYSLIRLLGRGRRLLRKSN